VEHFLFIGSVELIDAIPLLKIINVHKEYFFFPVHSRSVSLLTIFAGMVR